ncbi:MAG: transcription antitermination factor NusB [Woeseiaceae bacterium]|nr:transcription antitermination factor NusB [Woeseiaceae bacterium]MBT7276238.1 transcription antitermination factor NusB [Woeseiaceae bacterium]MDG1016514.1 transcription antitermination factor NusB [Woeseiaceae bacterium]MDG1712671.1 transcription antitermination factor NusB [Woeseiaceae bacterium]
MTAKKKIQSKLRKSRTQARIMLVQALYQMQLTDHDINELLSQCREREEYTKIDKRYFTKALRAIYKNSSEYQAEIELHLDRSLIQIDPIELSILLLGYYELEEQKDIDTAVIINEAVNLTKRFGSQDGHKYINAVLDRAGKTLRSV